MSSMEARTIVHIACYRLEQIMRMPYLARFCERKTVASWLPEIRNAKARKAAETGRRDLMGRARL